MTQQQTLSVSALKAKADVLDTFLKGKDVTLPRTQVLEAVAQMCGFPNWSTARAAAPKKEPKSAKKKASQAPAEKDFDVDIMRVGYACRTVEVQACSIAEAHDKAMAEADGLDFNEHHADYYIEGKSDAEIDNYEVTEEDKVQGDEATYQVELCQVSYGVNTITVRAKSQAEAEDLALDEAGNHYYAADDHQYAVNSVIQQY